ncbi:MAG: DNA primase, partial [Flavobacteriales bacterium]|nr:DNA primase [Flavobacteriales bacterium]
MITKATIQKIYDAAIIEDVIGDFVRLKKSGTSWKGLSPFSNERTPSFFVVPHKGIYKDFSSGKGGNVVDFLMEHEKLSYPEALRWLAAKYNIEIEEDQPSETQQQERSEREQLGVV